MVAFCWCPASFALFMAVGCEGKEGQEGLPGVWLSLWKNAEMGVERPGLRLAYVETLIWSQMEILHRGADVEIWSSGERPRLRCTLGNRTKGWNRKAERTKA